MKVLSEIIQGWTNLALKEFDVIDDETKRIANERMPICERCPIRRGNWCSSTKQGECVVDFFYIRKQEERKKGEKYQGCKCEIHAKAFSPHSQCPLGKFENIK